MEKDYWKKVVGFFTIIGAIAALLMVPEVRKQVGLDPKGSPQLSAPSDSQRSSPQEVDAARESHKTVSANPTNVALGKSVRISTIGVDANCNYCGLSPSDITDGSLYYEPASTRIPDGCVGWVNNNYGQSMVINVTIDLQGMYNITRIRYNTGNTQQADTWNADLMITPFASSRTNNGSPNAGSWTEHSGFLTTSSVTIVFKKTRVSNETDWLFIGEVEIYGVPSQ